MNVAKKKTFNILKHDSLPCVLVGINLIFFIEIRLTIFLMPAVSSSKEDLPESTFLPRMAPAGLPRFLVTEVYGDIPHA